MDAIVARSRKMLPPLTTLDRRVAEALATRALPALSQTYEELQRRVAEIDADLEGSDDTCGCDVALGNLALIVGFAINKLDGEGRYQDWMRDQSLEILENYRSLSAACAEDSGRASFASRITPELIETL